MRIKAVEIENVQAIRKVLIEPGGRMVTVIGGRNRQGKSSILKALEIAIRGKRAAPPEPVRHGEKAAHILVDLESDPGDDLGDLVIKRRISAAGSYSLEVTENGVKQRSPQELLNELVGARFLDPLKFKNASAKEQRAILLRCVKVELDLDQNAADRSAAFERRTELNRELKRQKAEQENLGPKEDAPEPISVQSTIDQIDALKNERRDHDDAKTRFAAVDAEGKDVHAKLAELTRRQVELKNEWRALNDRVASVDEATLDADIKAEEHRLSSSQETNTQAELIADRNERRSKVAMKVAELDVDVDECCEKIEKLDGERAEALGAAEMPIAGLEIGDEHLVYNGAPFEQAADSEQLQASLAIAAALSPDLRDVWIRDGALLDDESFEAVRRFAEDTDHPVWIERVGDDDAGAVIIEEGQVRG
jgi:DNA repair exonuclease SbcCD ATPase subunit